MPLAFLHGCTHDLVYRQEMNCQHAIIIENVEGQKSSLALCKLINCIWAILHSVHCTYFVLDLQENTELLWRMNALKSSTVSRSNAVLISL
jgi:hypothetical protein